MSTVERTCWCGKKFIARVADVKRGWAKCCCKSHAAHAREKKLDRFGFQRGESGTFHSRMEDLEQNSRGSWPESEDPSWDAHKGSF